MEKNVIVTDEFGNKLALTYPKRAKGLIKKGRAERVSENEIRLICGSRSPYMNYKENNMNNFNNFDNITDNNNITVDPVTGEVKENATPAVKKAGKPIFFNAREWAVGKTCPNTVATRSFISNPFGDLAESYTIGDWSWAWSQIETKDMILEKNTDYRFVFWLNGGENDQNNECCVLEIMFDNDYESRYSYKLNRSFIKYEKYYKGWYLYSIPFNTGDACYTKFSFISQRAYATILPAKDVDTYESLPEDNPIAGVPQRHNIIFGEGYPRNAEWSYLVFPDIEKNISNTSGKNVNVSEITAQIQDSVNERIKGLSNLSNLANLSNLSNLCDLPDPEDPEDPEDYDVDETVSEIIDETVDEIIDEIAFDGMLGDVNNVGVKAKIKELKENIKQSVRNSHNI